MNQSVYWHTPTLQVHDSRALGIRQVEYLRKLAGEEVQAFITRQHYDVAGRPVAQRDPRLPTPNTITLFALNAQALRTISVDAGITVTLPGLAGLPRQSWDANGNHRCMTYDEQLRPLTIEENGTPDVETMTYADSTHDADHNLRGQLIKLSDPSGTVEFHSIGLTGNGLHETRTFHDGKAFVSRRRFSPLGTALTQTDAGGHQQKSAYDVAGQLIRVQLQLKEQATWQTVLQDARYNAAGQIIEQRAGNGVTSHWHYRATDGRLDRHCIQNMSGPALQDFEYEYDRTDNITRILDHVHTPTFFRNQRVDGHREFRYDSLYRLIQATGYADAPPSDNLGRPLPTDPADRRNYVEHYEYDRGNNLIKTIHIRDGTHHTVEVFIDPGSNRGVRWKQGDPPPDFTRLFDPAGNLLALSPGVPMQWTSRGDLSRVTLVGRNGSSANDEEYYCYSQGERVYKRHDTHTTTVSHFHEVRYLPGLEIRIRDSGEELHLITLPLASGSAVCLHWSAGKPAGIDADQLRYIHSDHLGSVSIELNQQAQMISHEGYLPFGNTAWMAARTRIEVDYRFIRYSGKEMDVTGCYYYGARYYAPWLGRWTSADPEGPVDGPNLYAFVTNNPLRYIDATGNGKGEAMNLLTSSAPRDRLLRQANFHFQLLESVSLGVRDIEQQLLNHRVGNSSAAVSTAKRTGFFLAEKGVSFGVGLGLTAGGAALGVPGGPLGMVIMGAIGFGVSKGIGAATKAIGKETGLNTSVSLQADRLKADKLLKQTRADTGPLVDIQAIKAFDPRQTAGRELLQKQGVETGKDIALAAAGKIPYAGTAIKAIPGVIDVLKEVKAIGQNLSQEQIDALDNDITVLIDRLQVGGQRLIEESTQAGETQLLGRSLERIGQKTDKRIRELRNLQGVLHSGSARITAV